MKKPALSNAYISALCMELHLTFKAGITVSEGMGLLRDGEEDPRTREILAGIADSLESGENISAALIKSGAFPEYMTDTIFIGENTGKLDAVFKSLSEYYDRQDQLSSEIKNAVVYPVILLVMMMFVVVILITNVLPIFNDVFTQLGSTMPALAVWILGVGIGIQQNWVIIVIVLAVIIAAICVWAAVNRRRGDRVLMSKKIGGKVAVADFTSAMAMTLQSGLDLDESLDMAIRLVKSLDMKAKLERCRELIREGSGFSEAIAAAGVLPGLYCRLLAVGIKAGSSDTAMAEIARRSSDEAEDDIASRISKVEPTLVIIMSVIVGVVLLSVMLPLVGVMSSLG